MAQITFAFTVPKGTEWHPFCTTFFSEAQTSILAEDPARSGVFLIDAVNAREFPDPEWSGMSTVWFKSPENFSKAMEVIRTKIKNHDFESIPLERVDEKVTWWRKIDQIFFKLTMFDEIPQHVCLSEAQIVLLAMSGIRYHIFRILRVSREHLTGPVQASPWVSVYDCGFKKMKDLSKALKIIGERIKESVEPVKPTRFKFLRL